eukprot:TRINITY_DN53105_c0_g1_i1.p4 TRINITY_DN53105_c0_g1~~TRINITY_DN53105_c0_g1_i1.p4  ORF type:complete len:109 (+),score=20.82 TRINITY_DN53105_c0_g1_i1:119-445(+)
MRRRPPRSTQGVSSAASDVYKRQAQYRPGHRRQTQARQPRQPVAAFTYGSVRFPGTRSAAVFRVRIRRRTFFVHPHPRAGRHAHAKNCLLYTSPSPRDLSTSRMPSSA